MKYKTAYPPKDSIRMWLQAASLKYFQGWEIILTGTVIFCINKGHRPLVAIWDRNGILICFPHNIFTSVIYCGICLNHKLLINLDKWHATKEDTKSNHYQLLITGQRNLIISCIFYALYSNLKSILFMQCSGVILKITTDLHLVLIFLCQVRLFATRRLVEEDNDRPVRRIYGTGTIGWQNSALARRKFYDIKFPLSCQFYTMILPL